jgi:UDP-GlcNAc:undecaprenyl-phosphate/decaprenyl-phosphate GlcNAc-1-phosphate transferase
VLGVVGSAAASFCVCLLAIFALRPIAIAVDLIDRPGGRKTHHGNVPIVGGLAMYLGVVLGTSLLNLPGAAGGAFLAAATILVTVGLIDDRFELSPWTRLPAQVAAVIVLMTSSGVMVTSLGQPFGGTEIVFSQAGSVIFTILIAVAAINAFNMLDGMDGLAGTTALTSLLSVALVSWLNQLWLPLGVSLVIAGSICAFLVFNLPIRFNRPMRCFMGDAGSTLLGFSVAWLCIDVSQGPARAVSPTTSLWFVALPLYELLWTTARRLIRGVSPFRADNAHFHHLLLRAGFGVRGAFGVFVCLTLILAAAGLLIDAYNVSDSVSLLLLGVAGVGTVSLMYKARILWSLIPESLRRLPPLDPSTSKSPDARR